MRRAWLALVGVAACAKQAPPTKHRDALRAEAYRAWMDLQLCVGGTAPLPAGDAFVAHLDGVTRSRVAADDWPQRCAGYRDRLAGLLRAGDLPDVADLAAAVEIPKAPRWTAAPWDALAGAIAAANLPTYGWEAKTRPVPRPAPPSEPPLRLADLKVQPAAPAREAIGPAPVIPGAPPAGLDAADAPACASATTQAVIAHGQLALGTARDGWMVLPFAQPVDPAKPLTCGDGTAETVYARDGVWRVACSRAGCTYEHAALGDRGAELQDAVLSGGQLHAALRGAGGRVFLVRAADIGALASAALLPVVDAPGATVRLQPRDGGVAIVLEQDGKVRAVQITRDGQMFDL